MPLSTPWPRCPRSWPCPPRAGQTTGVIHGSLHHSGPQLWGWNTDPKASTSDWDLASQTPFLLVPIFNGMGQPAARESHLLQSPQLRPPGVLTGHGQPRGLVPSGMMLIVAGAEAACGRVCGSPTHVCPALPSLLTKPHFVRGSLDLLRGHFSPSLHLVCLWD